MVFLSNKGLVSLSVISFFSLKTIPVVVIIIRIPPRISIKVKLYPNTFTSRIKDQIMQRKFILALREAFETNWNERNIIRLSIMSNKAINKI